MGTVYRVRDERTGTRVALKQLELGAAQRSQEVRTALFQHEYHVLSELAHPHVVRVFDYAVDDGAPYYTMELLAGQDLQRASPMAWRRCCEILLELCSALAVLHSRGLVHRDVTPRNVLIGEDGRCKLIDFGAMTHMGPCHGAVGTPPYMAPELIQRQSVDGRSDVFALGGVAYFMLSARHAFPAARPQDLPAAWQQPPLPPSNYVDAVPHALDQLIMSMLSIEPEARPAQIAEVTQRLSALLGRRAEDSADEVRAHLATPKLVARDDALSMFRGQLKRAGGGRGTCLLARAEPGMGRSRLLETFALEAKLEGFLVLSTRAHKRHDREFAVMARLLELLSLAAAARAESAARGLEAALAGLWPPLSPDAEQAHGFDDRRIERQNALLQFFERLSEFVPLALVVDDAHLADPSSQQVLGRLAGAARARRILVLTSAPRRWSSDEGQALRQLQAQAEELALEPLSEQETEALLASVFGPSAELSRVAEWIHGVSEGRPQVAMQLATHLVERGFARFQGGRFELPDALEALDLPQNLEQAARTRLTALSPRARLVAELLVCATRFLPLKLSELLSLSSAHLSHAETFSALDELVQAQIVRPEGEAYVLVDEHLAELIRCDTDEERSRRHHRALAELYRERGRDHHCLAAYHFDRAGALDEAYPLMIAIGGLVVDSSSLTSIIARAPEGSALYEHMLRYCESAGLPPTARYRFRKVMLQLAAIARPELTRYADVTIAQLRRDIGLDHWEASAHISDPLARVVRCIEIGKERLLNTPEHERGLDPAAAIKELATCSALLVSAYSTMMDTAALDGVAPQLEPLRVLLPVLDIVYMMARMAGDSSVRGCDVVSERKRISDILSQPVVGMDELTRQGAFAVNSYYLGLEYAALGSDEALQVADVIERQPVYAVLGKQIRMLHALCQGSQRQAQRYREERDMLRALGANCESHLQLASRWEHVALYSCADLLGLGRLIKETAARARLFPGIMPRLHAMRAQYHLLCDEPAAALPEIAEGERLSPPLQNAAWRELALLRLEALAALDRFEEVLEGVRLAESHLQRVGQSFADDPRMAACEARALARSGESERARERLRPCIERLEARAPDGVPLARLYEALALVELEADDEDAFRQACARMRRICKRERHPGLSARYERLVSLAKKRARTTDSAVDAVQSGAGMFTEELLASQFQTQLAGFDEQEQLRELLGIVLEETQLKAGYLYRVSNRGRVAMLAHRGAMGPNPPLDLQLQHLLDARRQDGEDEATVVTACTEPGPALIVDAAKHSYVPLMLLEESSEARVIGVLLLRAQEVPSVRYAFVRAVTRTLSSLTRRRVQVA